MHQGEGIGVGCFLRGQGWVWGEEISWRETGRDGSIWDRKRWREIEREREKERVGRERERNRH